MLLLACLLLALPLTAIAVPSASKRDILSLLGVDTHTSSAFHSTRTALPTLRPFTRSSAGPSGKPSLSTSHSSAEQWTATPTPRTDSAEPTAVKTTAASTPSILPASTESHPTDHSSTTWQIVGIAIIAVLFVATSITCAMFFDRLWRFLKDVISCTPRPPASEEFILDCEKQIWDTRTLSPSPSDSDHYNGESLREEPSVYTTRARELPWNTDTHDWNALHRQPSRRNDHLPTA